MSFVNLSPSTSNHNENNQMNFNSASQQDLQVIDSRRRTLSINESFMKVPKSNLSIDHGSNHMEMCFNYDKCFSNTYEYSANSFNHSADNSFAYSTSNQTFDNNDQFEYDSNVESADQHHQTRKFFFSFATEFVSI